MKICPWCKQPIKQGEAIIKDYDGESLHLNCAVEIEDGHDIDRDLGDK
jgi:hypothetical protein